MSDWLFVALNGFTQTMAVEGLEDKLKENDNLIHAHNVQQRGAAPGHGYMGTGILVSIHCVRQAAPSRTCMDT